MIARHHSLRRAFLSAAVIALLVPAVSVLAIGQGRLQAEVVDADGNPLADVQVTITQEDIGYSSTAKTNKKGRFTLLVIDATRVYTFAFEKEGMPKAVLTFKMEPGGVTHHTFTLAPQAAAAPAAGGGAVTSARNKAINAFNEGVTALQGGDKATARAKFEEATTLDPDMAQPYSVLGTLYLEAGDQDRAIEAGEKLLELSPNDPAALVVLYDAHVAKGDTATANQFLDRLSAAGGGTDAAVRVFNAGADAARAGNLDTALTLFGKAIEMDSELAPAHAASARLLLVKERYEEALAAADKAISIDPDLVDVQRVRYEAFRRLGREDEAREVFEQLAAADPQGLAETLYDRGKAAFEAGETAAAVQALEQAVQARPDHARAHYMLGLSYANAGDNAKAKQHLEKFVELAPNDPEVGAAKEMIAYLG